jgi:hypothetical protein
MARKWGVIPTQDKPDQIDLVVRSTEPEVTPKAETTPEEDLIINEAIEEYVIENLDVEANPANSDISMEAREAIIQQPEPPINLDPPEKSLSKIIPNWCHKYLDVFTEKEAIPLPLHRPWDHHVKLTPDTPPSIFYKVYPLSQLEEEYQTKYISEQLEASLIQELKSPYATPIFYIKKKNGSH